MTDRLQKDIFVSCCETDVNTALMITEFLEDSNLSCFLYKNDIKPGEKHEVIVPKAIEGCKMFLLIESPAALKSEWVPNEITIAKKNHKRVLELQVTPLTKDQEDELVYKLGDSIRIHMHKKSELPTILPRLLDSANAILEELAKEAQKEDTKPETDEPQTEVLFDYDPELGIMYNPEDGQRNVSFRQDTFLTMMRTIYKQIGKENTTDVFFQCGYECGKNFGKQLNDKWKRDRLRFDEKLDKWCKFDSKVGWGKFISNIDLDEENNTLSGTLNIKECFFVDDLNQYEVCSYIKGYCTGVLEQLLRNKVKLTCTKQTCPMKNSFKAECVFNVAFEREE